MQSLMQVTDQGHWVVALYDRVMIGCHHFVQWDIPSSSSGEIQAVSLMYDSEDRLWCAVARTNKSLELYALDAVPPSHATTTMQTVTDPPLVTTTTERRITNLVFARMPSATTTLENGKAHMDWVVLAADVAGDVYAYRIQNVPSTTGTTTTTTHIPTPSLMGYVLLGHTASMISSLQWVPYNHDSSHPILDAPSSFILTADRDEKIRVSYFPHTTIIHGYLLGHSEFVTCCDVASTRPICVSVSGDGTLRLWDYVTCEELAVVNLLRSAPTENETHNTARVVVPTKVTLNPSGTMACVIYNDNATMDFYTIVHSSPFLVQLTHRKVCESQPLAIAFVHDSLCLCLSTAPPYIQAYQVTVSETADAKLLVVQDSAYALPSCIHNAIINRPTSVLERDANGRLKMEKLHETRAHGIHWNDSVRKDTARLRNQRHQKRRRERGDASEESDTHNVDEDEVVETHNDVTIMVVPPEHVES
jgi:uncharacterized protein YceK